MFGGTTIFYVEIWNHPIETTLENGLFGIPGISIYIIYIYLHMGSYIYVYIYMYTLLAVLIPNFQHLDSAEPPETSQKTQPNNLLLGGGFTYFFMFYPYLGRWSNLTSIFFRWVGSTTNLSKISKASTYLQAEAFDRERGALVDMFSTCVLTRWWILVHQRAICSNKGVW